ncbi:MAG: VWA domain-containing protein [Acidimicrobiales bacterium]|nr:VWA domain-containing protein [Acidimicrobiales bacterium]MYG87159.1 VWA domain-containing protein [Acidimicrobiales bacterium]MYI28507.1 VWA domain-containing protein [Acidimicrobiales bacterium]
MGTSSINGGLNGELERSSTAPWERGSDGTTASAGEPNATGAPRAKSGKTAKGGKKNGQGSTSDRSKAWMLLDRSGSMSGLEIAVVHGVNGLIAEQAALPGKCKITLVQFDSEDPFEILADAVPVNKACPLSVEQYRPRAATPLLDAIGSLIGRADERAKRRSKSGKAPEDQTVVIVTDGLENASTDFAWADIHRLISSRREQGWAFVFMGANQDSYFEGARLGVRPGNVQNYEASDEGVGEAFASVSRAYSERRAMHATVGSAPDDDFFGGVREAEEGMRRRSA